MIFCKWPIILGAVTSWTRPILKFLGPVIANMDLQSKFRNFAKAYHMPVCAPPPCRFHSKPIPLSHIFAASHILIALPYVSTFSSFRFIVPIKGASKQKLYWLWKVLDLCRNLFWSKKKKWGVTWTSILLVY